jgi:hypothetical protein
MALAEGDEKTPLDKRVSRWYHKGRKGNGFAAFAPK